MIHLFTCTMNHEQIKYTFTEFAYLLSLHRYVNKLIIMLPNMYLNHFTVWKHYDQSHIIVYHI